MAVPADLAALCGRPDGPALAPPPALVDSARRWATDLEQRSARLGQQVVVDPIGLLVGRAALSGFRRGGEVSCGGTARLLRSVDGWIAVNLARPDDWDLMDAWLEPTHPVGSGRWDAVHEGVSGRSTATLMDRATLLGLPAAALAECRRHCAVGETPGPAGVVPRRVRPVRPVRRDHPAPAAESLDGLVVVDLSALWAGPLAADLLARAGARVVKVESESRPDGARRGLPAFFDALHAGKESISLAFDTTAGRAELSALVSNADVVITAARPRALRQLGLFPEELVRLGGPRVWLSITGYGATGPSADRVAFGDDAAVAGGLVVWDDDGPCFCGDAVADPLSGLAGAAAVLASLEHGGGWVVDVSMADVAGGIATAGPGPALPATGPGPALPATGPGPVLPATGPGPALPATGPGPALSEEASR